MVTRRVSEDFNGFLANASGYQNTQFQKLICPDADSLSLATRFRFAKLFGVTAFVGFGEKQCCKNFRYRANYVS